MTTKPQGRPKKYAEYEVLYRTLPKAMKKRPKYINNIGIFRGKTADTAWVKIHLIHGGIYRGRSHPTNYMLEIKVGKLSSWSWQQLEAKRDELQGKADRKEPLEEVQIPLFKDYAELWLKEATHRLKGPQTPKYHLEKHFLPAFGKKSLDTITTNDINKWQSKRLKNAKPATVKREQDTLKAIFGAACKGSHPILKINPTKDINNIKGISGRHRALSEEEMLKLLKAANDTEEWLWDTILLMLHSGMRRSELLNLLWTDVIDAPDGRMFVQIKKSKSDEYRAIPCTNTMKNILKRFMAQHSDKPTHVFPYSQMTLRRRWETAREKAGLQGEITMHDLRTTNITYSVTSGVDLRTLAARAGHSNLDMFQKHYAALTDSATLDATNKIENVFTNMVSEKLNK